MTELTQLLEEKNESIAGLQKQVRACTVAMRNGGSGVAADGGQRALTAGGVGGDRSGAANGAAEAARAEVEQVKASFKEEAKGMRADFDRLADKLREVRARSCNKATD